MAINLFRSSFGNQQYSPAESGGIMSDLISKYGKSELQNTITKTTKGKPVIRTVTRTIAQPKKELIRYEGPEEIEPTIPLKGVFGSTPEQRKTYIREVEEYNKKIKQEKQKVADYNREIEAWNRSGRFQKVTTKYTETPIITTTETATIPLSKGTQTPITTNTTITKAQTMSSYDKLLAISPQIDFLKPLEKEKPTYISELKSQASQRYLTLPKAIGKGFQTIGESIETKDITKVSEPLQTSVGYLGKGVLRAPGAIYSGAKSAVSTAIKTQPFRKDFISDVYSESRAFREELKTPQRKAELTLIGAELLTPYAISRTPQAVTSVKYKLSGTKVSPESLYSKTAMASPRGLDLTYNPEKTISKFESTYGKTTELPKQYVGVSQTTTKNLGSTVKTKSQLGQKLTEDPGLFISPKGAGQTRFLRLSGETPKKITLDPRKLFTQGQPTTFQVGFKELGRYPQEVISAKGYTSAEAYQLTQSTKSKAIITKMSELGKSEPEAVIPVGSKLAKVKTPLYYTEVKNTIVPIKTITVLGTGSKATKDLTSLSTVRKGTSAYESLLRGEKYVYVNPSVILPNYRSNIKSSSSYKPSTISSLIYPTKPILSPVSPIKETEEPSPIPSTLIPSKISITKSSISGISKSKTITSTSSLPPTYEGGYPILPKLIYSYSKKTPKFIPMAVLPKERKKKEIVTGEPAYDVYIRVGNNWVNKTQGKRNIYSAIEYGSDIVDNTVTKSFKIKKGTGRANIFKYNLPYNINKFYTPSKTRSAKLTGAYIEKNKYAIDTVGEKQGLSIAKYLRGVRII